MSSTLTTNSEAQIHGGTLQALGRALGEELSYNEDGQLLSTTFIDYALPSIDQAPDVQTVLVEVPALYGPSAPGLSASPPPFPGRSGGQRASSRWRPTHKQVAIKPEDLVYSI